MSTGNISRVAVIGAGPSGLATVKAAAEQGLEVVCYEAEARIGGIFNFDDDPRRPSVWESCNLVSSMYVTCFSDFVPRLEHRQFHHSEYHAYLTDYAEHFDLIGKIRLKTRVTQVEWEPTSGTFTVDTECEGARNSSTFDAVAVCSGLHSRPYIPAIDGLESFPGAILHSAEYRSRESVPGRRILVVGAGESGADIANELADGEREVIVSLRRGAFVLPRLIRGYPSDYFGTRLFYSLPDFLARRSDDGARSLKAKYARVAAPLRALPNAAHRGMVRLQEWKHRGTGPSRTVVDMIMQMRQEVGGTQFEYFATKSDAFLRAVADGRATLAAGLSGFEGSTAVFMDGTSADFDSVVFCTGFASASAPFLDETLDLRRLYLRIFDPAHRGRLAFIGFARPSLGAIPPISEMQARLWVSVLLGRTGLPSQEEMESSIGAMLTAYADEFPTVHERLPHQVDFSVYLEELAETLGCKPRISSLRDLGLLARIYLTPYSSVQYRLSGPGSAPEAAKTAMRSVPLTGDGIKMLDLLLARLWAPRDSRFLPRLTLGPPPRQSRRAS